MQARLDEEAAAALRALPLAVRTHVYRFVTRTLAPNPHQHSRPAAFPHPLKRQLADTKCDAEGFTWYITLMFQFSADEAHIDIAWIIHQKRELPEDSEE